MAQHPRAATGPSACSLHRKLPHPCHCKPQVLRQRASADTPANILIDVVHVLPPDIESLLPFDLRDILDPPSLVSKHTCHNAGELAERIRQLAAVYRDESRELAGKPGSEPEYRTHLYSDVVEKLARIPTWRRTLSANCSDKLWHASLKPSNPNPNPVLSLLSSTWTPLLPNPVAAQALGDASPETSHNSLDSSVVRVRPNSSPFNFVCPPPSIEPSESSTASEPDGTLSTPKPDITVGISLDAFIGSHAGLLEYWQANEMVLSDPHATQGDMRFPFLLFESKGLVTNGILIGAQNQAAGGGACAIRLLESLAAQDTGTGLPRIVFSVTTEGAIHELWVHYRSADEDNIQKDYMTCLGTWRTTLDRHSWQQSQNLGGEQQENTVSLARVWQERVGHFATSRGKCDGLLRDPLYLYFMSPPEAICCRAASLFMSG
ncbi:hypothetical protein EJ04DRAFT_530224 [Polyplosphaeria fusca]|uniref:DUF7924 domain-containing protein n=1 Tax=Polyplosphaeria fusca TaxID=682080 RepID=A0A9P4QFU0_9PLEO|nr:hypothetical protein EJ04DRAFT_530224 [Polyplosphaeria fusca]